MTSPRSSRSEQAFKDKETIARQSSPTLLLLGIGFSLRGSSLRNDVKALQRKTDSMHQEHLHEVCVFHCEIKSIVGTATDNIEFVNCFHHVC